MPAKVKLLNNAAAGATGHWIKIGTGPPPVTIRTSGGYALGSGTAGTNGVTIQISGDQGVNEPAMVPMGIVGGGSTDASTANLTDLANLTVASMPYYPAAFIRAVTGANMTGNATVFMEFPR
jgi:hypothetical protein